MAGERVEDARAINSVVERNRNGATSLPKFPGHNRIRSTSFSVISFFVRSQSLVVRGDLCLWPTIC